MSGGTTFFLGGVEGEYACVWVSARADYTPAIALTTRRPERVVLKGDGRF